MLLLKPCHYILAIGGHEAVFCLIKRPQGGDQIKRKELNEENEEIKNKAYELYDQHGFKDGNTIGYGRTNPAFYEVTPGDINTKEAKANMKVLFEIVVK